MNVNLKKFEEIERINSDLINLNINEKQFLENSTYGNIEYNLKITNNNLSEIEKHMFDRLEEGDGECFFELGLNKEGEKIGFIESELKESVFNLEKISSKHSLSLEILKFYRGETGMVAEIKISNKNLNCLKFNNLNKFSNSNIGLFGEETSGKSTLVGVLVNNTLDNGDGSARHNIFRFQHEIQIGKTTSISHQVLEFNLNGDLIGVNKINVELSTKIISLFDLGGSERAFKTTLSTLSRDYLDYFFLIMLLKA